MIKLKMYYIYSYSWNCRTSVYFFLKYKAQRLFNKQAEQDKDNILEIQEQEIWI